MSADTTTAVVKVDDKWYCGIIQNAEDFEISWLNSEEFKEFDKKSECFKYAHNQEWTEYGVQILGEFSNKLKRNDHICLPEHTISKLDDDQVVISRSNGESGTFSSRSLEKVLNKFFNDNY